MQVSEKRECSAHKSNGRTGQGESSQGAPGEPQTSDFIPPQGCDSLFAGHWVRTFPLLSSSISKVASHRFLFSEPLGSSHESASG